MTTWKQIPGGLARISAGSRTNVWGVNSGSSVYRYTLNDANPWVQIPGGLSGYGAKLPSGRLGRPEDVAAVTAFLLSDDAVHVNGAIVAVDAGVSARLATPPLFDGGP